MFMKTNKRTRRRADDGGGNFMNGAKCKSCSLADTNPSQCRHRELENDVRQSNPAMTLSKRPEK